MKKRQSNNNNHKSLLDSIKEEYLNQGKDLDKTLLSLFPHLRSYSEKEYKMFREYIEGILKEEK